MPMTVQPTDLLLRRVRLGLGGELADVRVADGTVVAIQEVGAATDGAEVVPGDGGTLLPGLRDAHVHMSQWAAALQRVDLSHTDSAADAVEVMRRSHLESGRPDVPVLIGFGFRDGLWPDAPHKDLLDRAIPGAAVVLVSQDLHCAWFSPAALQLVGIDHPTGLLREAECFGAMGALPEASPADLDRWAVEAARAAAARGVTEIIDFEFTDTIETWRRRATGSPYGLPVRVRAAIRPGRLAEAIDRGWRTSDVVPDTGGLVTVGPCKALMDGSLNTRTALCHDPYPGISDPTQSHGLSTQDPEELVGMLKLGAQHGLSFAVHAIGDQANTLALDCFQTAGIGGRIEHAQLVDPTDLARFAELGVIASVQPAHAVEDRDVADRHWAGRTGSAFPYGALAAAGATLEFGSDAPVSRLDPWYAIAAAVTRTLGERPPWHREQVVSVEQAVAASAGGRTAPAVGNRADLVLVQQDPCRTPPAELADITVLATILAGRISYRAS